MQRVVAATALVACLAFAPGFAPAEEPTPEALVDALNAVFGRHKGLRASHAKGLCAEGRFEPTAAGRKFSSSPLFAGPAPVTARFSIAGGNPKVSDKARAARGLALRVHLADGAEHDLVMLSTPMFFAPDPETFVGFLQVRVPDPATGKPDPDKVKAFAEAHPETKRQAAYLAEAPISASDATLPYFAIHTFILTDAQGRQQPARWVLEPAAGVQGLSEAELEPLGDDYLAAKLRERVATGPAAWSVQLQLPAADDPLTDPTVAWPDDRQRVEVGRLEITGVAAEGASGACDPLVFLPDNLAAGIEPVPGDPILAARSAAYAVSLARRME
jgi:catalase